MTTPTVTELPQALEPTTADPFIDDVHAGAPPDDGGFGTRTTAHKHVNHYVVALSGVGDDPGDPSGG